MKLLGRGIKLAELSIATLIFALIFWDPVLAVIAVLLIVPILIDYVRLSHAIRSYVKLSQTESVVRGVHGEDVSTSVILDVRYRCRARVYAEGFKTYPNEVDGIGEHEVKIVLERPSPGTYRLGSVVVAIRSELELVEVSREFDIDITFKVYPAATVAIARAIRVLASAYEVGGEASIERPSRTGTEYYGTREYIEGEPLNVIDWKATARHMKLCIKEFCSEVGASDTIIFEASSSDRIALDLVQASVVTALLDSAVEGRRVTVAVMEDGEVRVLGREVSGVTGLKTTIVYILSKTPQLLPELEELLDPAPYRYTMKLLERYRHIASMFAERVKDIRLVINVSGEAPRIYSAASEPSLVLTLCAEAKALGKQPTVYIMVGDKNVARALKLVKTLEAMRVLTVTVSRAKQALK